MKRRHLLGELEQLLDDAEDVIRLARTFVEMRRPRWQGALEELQRLESMARDGVALVCGARSEETISKATPRRTPSRGKQAPGACRGPHRRSKAGCSSRLDGTGGSRSTGRRGSGEGVAPASPAAANPPSAA
jgi:hypothetical protein